MLTQKDKLTMERLFRSAIPDRKKSSFVFRKGNSLLPKDLGLVSAVEAASILVVSDNSRASNESDAESVRAAVLIDEAIERHEGRLAEAGLADDYVAPHVIIEMQNGGNCAALQFATRLGARAPPPARDTVHLGGPCAPAAAAAAHRRAQRCAVCCTPSSQAVSANPQVYSAALLCDTVGKWPAGTSRHCALFSASRRTSSGASALAALAA